MQIQLSPSGRRPIRPLVFAFCVAFAASWLIVLPGAGADPVSPPTDIRDDVWTIIEGKCLRCHNEREKKGKLDMSSLAAMLTGGESGPALRVGNSAKSLMIDLIDFDEMPPRKEKPRVSKTELEKLRAWIDAGAAGRAKSAEPAAE